MRDNPKGLRVFFQPIGALILPPLWEWSTTIGRLPNQHLDLAHIIKVIFILEMLDIKIKSI